MTNTPIEALSAINVGVVNDQGLLTFCYPHKFFQRQFRTQAPMSVKVDFTPEG